MVSSQYIDISISLSIIRYIKLVSRVCQGDFQLLRNINHELAVIRQNFIRPENIGFFTVMATSLLTWISICWILADHDPEADSTTVPANCSIGRHAPRSARREARSRRHSRGAPAFRFFHFLACWSSFSTSSSYGSKLPREAMAQISTNRSILGLCCKSIPCRSSNPSMLYTCRMIS